MSDGNGSQWVRRWLSPRDPFLSRIEAEAGGSKVGVTSPEVGRFLGVLARATRTGSILEIGTGGGYATACLARSATSARVVSIDRDAEAGRRASQVLESAGKLEQVEFLVGDALDILPRLESRFGLAYVDAEITDYRRLLDLMLPMLEVGGVVVFDRLLGNIVDERVAEAFTGYVSIHPQLESLLVPFADGLAVGSKTRPLITELGGPF